MEDINDDEPILDELISHFKDFSSDIIKNLYEANNKDLSKTIDSLLENEKLINKYENKDNAEPKFDEINENKNNLIDNNEEEEDEENSDFYLLKDSDDEKNQIDDNKEKEIKENNIIENNNNKEKEKIDDNILNFLIELAPFNTVEEIEEKIILYNFDYDKVIASLLDNYKSDNNANQESDDKNKFNDLKTSLRNKKEKRRKKEKREKKDKIENDEGERRYRKYDEYKVLEFLEKNKNKQRIDLHGFKLSESMIIVKKKLEEMEQIVKENKVEKLLIIVTGRGNHSPGNKPVLRPNILRWLKSKNYNVNEKDPGALYVLIQ